MSYDVFTRDELPAPGPLPPGACLPCPRNPRFASRQDDLLALARALADGAGGPVLVHGPEGMGKTQLAVEFAYRYGRYLVGVHWINAAQPELIADEIADCGAAMGQPDFPQEQPEQVVWTLQAWHEGGPRLVVLDNLGEMDATRAWLPRLQGGEVRLLLTSSQAGAPSMLQSPPTNRGIGAASTRGNSSSVNGAPADLGLTLLPLAGLAPEESRALLRHDRPAADAAELDALAEWLGHLPLALELAGRYLQHHPSLSVPAYIELLANAVDQPALGTRWSDLGAFSEPLLAVLSLSWAQVEDAVARRLFLLAGHCAPDAAILRDLLRGAAGLAEADCQRGLDFLLKLGLLYEAEEDVGLAIHPLLAAYARAQAEAEELLPMLTEDLICLSSRANWCDGPADFLPLRQHVARIATAEGMARNYVGWLWDQLGYHWQKVDDYARARAAHERALGILEQRLGNEDPTIVYALGNLGDVMWKQGDLAGARAVYERALALGQRIFGPSHHRRMDLFGDLGRLLYKQGDLAGARAAYEQMLAVEERFFGADSEKITAVVCTLGQVLQESGDFSGAQAAFRRALQIDKRVHGTDHPSVARDISHFGEMLFAQGDYARAGAAYKKALRIYERAFGAEHPEVAVAISNLGVMLFALHDLVGARAAFEQALKIGERVYGSNHPELATCLGNLGDALQELGDLTEARAAYERALALLRRARPPDHAHVWIIERNLQELEIREKRARRRRSERGRGGPPHRRFPTRC